MEDLLELLIEVFSELPSPKAVVRQMRRKRRFRERNRAAKRKFFQKNEDYAVLKIYDSQNAPDHVVHVFSINEAFPYIKSTKKPSTRVVLLPMGTVSMTAGVYLLEKVKNKDRALYINVLDESTADIRSAVTFNVQKGGRYTLRYDPFLQKMRLVGEVSEEEHFVKDF